ncbi:PCSK6 isoform 14, partial [Pongo abelii]
ALGPAGGLLGACGGSHLHLAPTPRRPPDLPDFSLGNQVSTFGKEVEVPEDEEDYTGVCHPECGDKGCDGPSADQCLNCVHFSLGSVKTSRKCVSVCPLGYFGDTAARRCRRCHKGCETCSGRGAT